MKAHRALTLSLLLLTAAGFSSVSSAQGLTRAEVRADLVRVEQAGYNPSAGEDTNYPANIQAAEAKVTAEDQQVSLQAKDAVGGAPMGTSAASTKGVRSKSTPSSCVGPVSFCDIYFGS